MLEHNYWGNYNTKAHKPSVFLLVLVGGVEEGVEGGVVVVVVGIVAVLVLVVVVIIL